MTAPQWVFRPGRRTAHHRADWSATKAPCGQALSGTRPVSTYDPNHVGIGPCLVCTRILQAKRAAVAS